MTGRPALTIIQTTAASLEAMQSVGLFDRHRRLLQAYADQFAVIVYSPDARDFSDALGLPHCPMPWLPRAPGLKHLAYYLWLVWRAPRMRGVLKVFGCNIPSLPLIKRLAGCPVMVTYEWDYAEQIRRSERNPLRRWLAPWLERIGLSAADMVAITADWLEGKIRTVYRKPTVLLPEWVDLEQGGLAAFAPVRDEAAILFAGRLHWSKGIDVLLAAFEQVARRQPGARLIICGTGPEQDRLAALARRMPGVNMRGRLTNAEVLRLMRSCGMFVLPTLTMEGQPKALVEALACGAACIATAVPGNRELIDDGVTGLLVPPKDAAALAVTLQRVLADSALRSRLGQAAAQYAQRFDFSEVVASDIRALIRLGTGNPSVAAGPTTGAHEAGRAK